MIQNSIKLFLLTLILLVIQSLWNFEIFFVKPDIILLTTVFIALVRGPHYAAGFALLAGLLKDTLSLAPIGLSSFCLAILGFIIGNIREQIYRESIFTQIFLAFLGSLFYGFTYVIILNLIGKNHIAAAIFNVVFPASIYTAIICPLIFLALSKLNFLTQPS